MLSMLFWILQMFHVTSNMTSIQTIISIVQVKLHFKKPFFMCPRGRPFHLVLRKCPQMLGGTLRP